MYVKTTRPEPAVSKLRPVKPISIKHEPLRSASWHSGRRRIAQRKQAGYPWVRCISDWRGRAGHGNRTAVGKSHKPARRADPELCPRRELLTSLIAIAT